MRFVNIDIRLFLAFSLLFLLFHHNLYPKNYRNTDPDLNTISTDSLFLFLENETSHPGNILEIIHSRIQKNDFPGKAKYLKKIGEYYYKGEILDSASYYFKKGNKYAESENMDDLSAFFFLRLGMIENTRANYSRALELLQNSKEKILETDSYSLQSDIYRNTGNIYWGMGSYEKALNNYLISLDIAKKHGLTRNIASATNNIGNVYQAIHNYESAREYYQNAYDLAKENDYKWIAAIASNNIGDLLNILKKQDSSIYYFDLSLEMLDELDSKFYKGIILFNIGDIYLQLDSIEKAREYLTNSLELAKLSDDKLGIVNCYLKFGESYLKKDQLEQANHFINKGMENAREIGSFNLLERVFDLKTDYYTKSGLMDSAFMSQKTQLEFKDSIFSQESGEAIARLENRYKEEKTALEIEGLKKDKINSRRLFIVIVSAISIILIIIIISLYNARKRSMILTEKNLEIELQRKLLLERNEELTRSQEELKNANEGKNQFLTILSHDLRNPITAIRGFVELLIKQYDTFPDEKKKLFLQEILDSVEKLSLLLTNVLFWVRSQSHGIKNHPQLLHLAKRIDTTISLYSLIAKDKGIEMHNNVPEDIHIFADQNVFDTIIRNLISNSLKFTDKGGQIKFEAEIADRQIILKISDSGIGMNREKIEKIMQVMNNTSSLGTQKEQGTGLGLTVVQDFVLLMGGNLSIESTQGKGSTFIIKLPLPKTS